MKMDAEKLALQRRIDKLDEYATRLHATLTEAERENARLKAELETVKRQREALLKTIDVEYIASLEEKAIKLEVLEATLKRGLRAENGGAE
ncbi:MAG: hypothetical protein J6V52_05300 [Bacteroidaceae bacterium]|nr:hypothetical protein [Bacteroidaceae bacterium]